MANIVAYLALSLWPLVAIWLYKRKEVIPATFWTIVGGHLFLPIGFEFDFPLIPVFDKRTVPTIMAYIGCKYISKTPITLLPPAGLERKLMLLLFLGAIGTVMSNRDAIVEVDRYLPGLGYHDIFSVIMAQFILLLPITLGLQVIKTPEDQIKLFKLLVAAGLIYSIFIIFELRMSPQLHKWVYGYFPYMWGQHERYGGFRPVVFLGHGLWVSIFIVTVLSSALTLSKIKLKLTKHPNFIVLGYLFLLLIFAKGFGAIILGMVVFLSITFLSVQLSNRLALLITLVAVTYPLLCVFNLFPHDYLIENIKLIDSAQAGSLQFRFGHEAALLDRALEKIVFGWGAWGRNRLPDSVVDGYWISVIGMYGTVGFVAIFGLMLSGVLRATAVFKTLTNNRDKVLMAGHAMLVSVLILDQVPNHSENPLFWFLIGSLAGRHYYSILAKKEATSISVSSASSNGGASQSTGNGAGTVS